MADGGRLVLVAAADPGLAAVALVPALRDQVELVVGGVQQGTAALTVKLVAKTKR
jgi:hypothetical protein